MAMDIYGGIWCHVHYQSGEKWWLVIDWSILVIELNWQLAAIGIVSYSYLYTITWICVAGASVSKTTESTHFKVHYLYYDPYG